jgi:hypothetical protein
MSYPTTAEVAAALAQGGRSVSTGDLTRHLNAAISAWEGLTSKPFLADASSGSHVIPPGGSSTRVLPVPFTEITAVACAGTTFTLGTDVTAEPRGAPSRSRPYTYLEFAGVLIDGTDELTVTGKRGYATACPDEVKDLLIRYAAASYMMAVQSAGTTANQVIKKAEQDSVSVEYFQSSGASAADTMVNIKKEMFALSSRYSVCL